jgi:hypothetical protein
MNKITNISTIVYYVTFFCNFMAYFKTMMPHPLTPSPPGEGETPSPSGEG